MSRRAARYLRVLWRVMTLDDAIGTFPGAVSLHPDWGLYTRLSESLRSLEDGLTADDWDAIDREIRMMEGARGV